MFPTPRDRRIEAGICAALSLIAVPVAFVAWVFWVAIGHEAALPLWQWAAAGVAAWHLAKAARHLWFLLGWGMARTRQEAHAPEDIPAILGQILLEQGAFGPDLDRDAASVTWAIHSDKGIRPHITFAHQGRPLRPTRAQYHALLTAITGPTPSGWALFGRPDTGALTVTRPALSAHARLAWRARRSSPVCRWAG